MTNYYGKDWELVGVSLKDMHVIHISRLGKVWSYWRELRSTQEKWAFIQRHHLESHMVDVPFEMS